METLKSMLKFWQEIVFIISIGLLLIVITNWTIRIQSMDVWSIFIICYMLPLFICLIGQLFWKKRVVSIILSAPLVLSSAITTLMALYGVFNSPSNRIECTAMLVVGVVLIVAAVKMPAKYSYDKVRTLKA